MRENIFTKIFLNYRITAENIFKILNFTRFEYCLKLGKNYYLQYLKYLNSHWIKIIVGGFLENLNYEELRK